MIAAVAALGDLQVTNFEPGSLVRYPVVIFRGRATGPDVAAGLGWPHMIHFPVTDGRFVAVAELKPGMNMVMLTSGSDVLKMRLDYRPATTPYRVACYYLAPRDESTNFDAPPGERSDQYGEKLDTALKLLQGITAEAMNDAGQGRKTFALEFDAKGRVPMHVLRAGQTGGELRAMDQKALWGALDPVLPTQGTTKICAITSFPRYNRGTGDVLGRSELADDHACLVSGESMFAWPTYLSELPSALADVTPIDRRLMFDDSGGRGLAWALTTTTMGNLLHQLAWTFGEPGGTGFGLMGPGALHLNRFLEASEPDPGAQGKYIFKPDEIPSIDATVAERFSRSPWFQPDIARAAPK